MDDGLGELPSPPAELTGIAAEMAQHWPTQDGNEKGQFTSEEDGDDEDEDDDEDEEVRDRGFHCHLVAVVQSGSLNIKRDADDRDGNVSHALDTSMLL